MCIAKFVQYRIIIPYIDFVQIFVYNIVHNRNRNIIFFMRKFCVLITETLVGLNGYMDFILMSQELPWINDRSYTKQTNENTKEMKNLTS